MILVIGATSPVGRTVTEQLVRAGRPVRALSRRPAQAGLPGPVDVVVGDLDQAATLRTPLADMTAVFVFAGQAEHVRTLVEAAQEAGVRRLVLWSSGAVQDDVIEQPDAIAANYAAMESAVTGSGLEHTIVRVEFTAANALLWTIDLPGQVKAGDVVRGPYAEAAQAPVHGRDVAAVAVAALTAEGHHGHCYRLTGPQSLTHREQVEIIGSALGRQLRYEEVSAEEARQASGLPPFLLDPLFRSWSQHTGVPAEVTGTVEQVTGRPALCYEAWVADHLDLFR
jgi:uncharacterized protein YbjT (DUF2867 family)